MAFNVSTFMSSGLVWGGSRPTQFDVSFAAPPGVALASASLQKLPLLCTAASLPASDLGVAEVSYFGRKIPYSGDREFAPWTITVLNDEDFLLRSMFEYWSNYMNQMVANIATSSDPSQYMTDLTVEQYGKDGEIIRQYQMISAWPRSVEEIELNWDASNQVESFRVTMVYADWIPTVETSSKNSGQNAYGSLGASQSTTTTNT